MSLWFIPGYLGTATEFGTVQTVTVTSTDHGNLEGLGDDDHTQYGAIAQNETITGAWTFANTATMRAIEFQAHNTYDIGTITTKPRDGYFSRDLLVSGSIFLALKMQLTEIAAPGNAPVNTVWLYAEDNGAGKTRLMAVFPTGAAQQIAIEP